MIHLSGSSPVTSYFAKWNAIEAKLKVLYDDQPIRYKKSRERKKLINLLADEFPEVSRVRIASAIDYAKDNWAISKNRLTFLNFMKNYLK
ncbi:MAG: hypothetical protein RL427_1185 [Bacteroidota bacterium]|jgi:hypothetical protein